MFIRVGPGPFLRLVIVAPEQIPFDRAIPFRHNWAMIISLKAFATLHKYMPENFEAYELEDGTTVKQLLELLGLVDEQVKLVFINGAHVSRQAVIAQGDRVGLFPAVGGG